MMNQKWNLSISNPDNMPSLLWMNLTAPLIRQYVGSNGFIDEARITVDTKNGWLKKYHVRFTHNEDTIFMEIEYAEPINKHETSLVRQVLVDSAILQNVNISDKHCIDDVDMKRWEMDRVLGQVISTPIHLG